jgi:hypothetical protein
MSKVLTRHCWGALLALGTWALPLAASAATVGFEDLPLAPDQAWSGEDTTPYAQSGDTNYFASGGVSFRNYCELQQYTDTHGQAHQYRAWDGWAYSNLTDATTPDYSNQCSAVAGGGAQGSAKYAVGYYAGDYFDQDFNYSFHDLATDLPQSEAIVGGYFTNTTYNYFTLKDGNAFARKFGRVVDPNTHEIVSDTDAPDYFLLTITGKNGNTQTGHVDFYLADYRFADHSQDYIVSDWQWVDLQSLGAVDRLEFTFTSSDFGSFGMNTPTYVAMDNLTTVPEPGAFGLLLTAGMAALGWRRRSRSA